MSAETGAGIYWLASYPKSGNTWMRAFLTGLTGKTGTIDINALDIGEIASNPRLLEETLGFEIGELSHDEIDRLRPHAYRCMAAQAREAVYHKIHDAYTWLQDGTPLIPPDSVLGVLYIVRNPLDVAVSFAHHCGCDIDMSIRNMGNHEFSLCGKPGQLQEQLRQRLLSWSGHVRSWLDAPKINRLLIRYEDMQDRPLETFAAAARFFGLPDDESSVAEALESCKMEDLQKQEREKGFREKISKGSRFFRKGVVGDWLNALNSEQVETVIADHRDVMAALGYLDAAGRPLEASHHMEATTEAYRK